MGLTWQSIETARKDGTLILVGIAGYAWLQQYKLVYWGGMISDSTRPGHSTVGWHDQFDDEDEDEPLMGFTHWMDIPPLDSDPVDATPNQE